VPIARHQGGVARIVGVGEAEHADLIAEQLAGALDRRLEHLVDGKLIHDAPLKLRQPLQQHLALSKRPEQALVLGRVALGVGAKRSLVLEQPQVTKAERQHPGQPREERALIVRKRPIRAPGHHEPKLPSAILKRGRDGRAPACARDGHGARSTAGNRDELPYRYLAVTEADRCRHRGTPNERRDLGAENLGHPRQPTAHRRPLVRERGDQGQKFRQLLGALMGYRTPPHARHSWIAPPRNRASSCGSAAHPSLRRLGGRVRSRGRPASVGR
jgi:hypothetical protein